MIRMYYSRTPIKRTPSGPLRRVRLEEVSIQKVITTTNIHYLIMLSVCLKGVDLFIWTFRKVFASAEKRLSPNRSYIISIL